MNKEIDVVKRAILATCIRIDAVRRDGSLASNFRGHLLDEAQCGLWELVTRYSALLKADQS